MGAAQACHPFFLSFTEMSVCYINSLKFIFYSIKFVFLKQYTGWVDTCGFVSSHTHGDLNKDGGFDVQIIEISG